MTEPQQMREPAWLTHLCDQRLALITETLPKEYLEIQPIITTPLTEPPPGADKATIERWDRSCDNCGAFVPEGTTFYTGSVRRDLGETPVLMFYGACAECQFV